MDIQKPPAMTSVLSMGRAPDHVETIVRTFNGRRHKTRLAGKIVAKSVTRAGHTHVQLDMMGYRGALSLSLGATDEATVMAAIDVLARAFDNKTPVTHLVNPGARGENAPLAPPAAPREVTTVV
jgi:hypothetical protein